MGECRLRSDEASAVTPLSAFARGRAARISRCDPVPASTPTDGRFRRVESPPGQIGNQSVFVLAVGHRERNQVLYIFGVHCYLDCRYDLTQSACAEKGAARIVPRSVKCFKWTLPTLTGLSASSQADVQRLKSATPVWRPLD